jgi:hypothetical protein
MAAKQLEGRCYLLCREEQDLESRSDEGALAQCWV